MRIAEGAETGGLYRPFYLHAKNLRVALRFLRKNW